MKCYIPARSGRLILALGALLASLTGAACPTMDLTGDCRGDLEDFALFAAQWLDEGVPDSADLEFVTIPAGSFQMGDNFAEGWSEERPVHTVTLSSFQMSRHEITNAQYVQFLNAAQAQGLIKLVGGVVYPSADSSNSQPWCDTSASDSDSQIISSGGSYTVRIRDGESQEDHPVVQVSWYGAQAFCDFYGYKLPTEAQWEYAVCGGNSGWRFPWGEYITHNNANYHSEWSGGKPHYIYDVTSTADYHPTYNTGTKPYTAPVGSFPANGYGLHDMAGNVWEWCSDWYGVYSTSNQINPTGPDSGIGRVLRGGGWVGDASFCRVAHRAFSYPDTRIAYIGLRVCRY